MRINYNVSGSDRQKLARMIAKATGNRPVYQNAPTFDYMVGDVTITCEGVVIIPDGTNAVEFHRIVDGIGFQIADADCGKRNSRTGEWSFDVDQNEPEPEQDALAIMVPGDGITDAQYNAISRLIATKRTLICHSLGAESIDISRSERGRVVLTITPMIMEPEMVDAAERLFIAIVEYGRNLERVPTKEKATINEKYTFRCFLLRLGFIGDETKKIRKQLLKNLTGCASYKNGVTKK